MTKACASHVKAAATCSLLRRWQVSQGGFVLGGAGISTPCSKLLLLELRVPWTWQKPPSMSALCLREGQALSRNRFSEPLSAVPPNCSLAPGRFDPFPFGGGDSALCSLSIYDSPVERERCCFTPAMVACFHSPLTLYLHLRNLATG